MAHMRDKTVHCLHCHCNVKITANLDEGRVTSHNIPQACQSRAKCLDDFATGIFDRRFGERIISPERF